MEVTEILPNIWMGNASVAASRTFAKSKKIRLSVNCSQKSPNPEINGIQTFSLRAVDSQDLYTKIEAVTELIGKAFQQLIPVLVWCEDGRQASATVIASFYIRFTGNPWNHTVRMIQSKVPDAFRPEISYLSCLSKLQEDFTPEQHDIL